MLRKKVVIIIILLFCLFLGCVANPTRTGASFTFGTSGWLAKIVGISLEIDISVTREAEDEDINCASCISPVDDGMRKCPPNGT